VGDRGVPRTEVTSEQTAQGQLANILDSDSPLMQRAATQGAQAANSRGLLNSSMASQAAQGAMIDRAAPIASQDAETYFQNAQANAGREQQDYMQRLGFEQDLASAAQRYEIDSALLEQEGNQAMERLYGTSLANAWGVMGNNVTDIVAQSLANIQTIQNNPNIDPESKTEMIQKILDMREADTRFQAELYGRLPYNLDDTGVFPEIDLKADSFEEAQVLQAYEDILGRQPSNESLSYYTQRVRQQGIENVRSEIAGSPEAKSKA